ncbi:MAG: cation:proton antiporter [Nitriliruptoraceae bacterium]|nr:cation:proton antiporter [Nitriliruptoraceae bacterium]
MAFDLPTLPLSEPGIVFAALLAAVLLAPMLARRLRLPEVVVVLVVGFAIGPTGIGLLERVGVVQSLGYAGLLYLMFVAGLELDLDDFIEHRTDSLAFGTMTFVVPMVLGTATSLALGYGPLASLLLASCWASHTLVTYPIFQRVGTVGNRAVATSVGATIITDTAALLVLAVVARAHQGELSAVFWATLLPSLAIVTSGVVAGLPRLARWFFSGWGQDRSLRFLFVLVALFTTASLFDAIGIEAIVGAFLAGLVLNRSVPNSGALMGRLTFFGETFFIPLFLVATGMLIDLQVLLEPRTLLIGGAFTAVALVAKLLAALGAGRLLGYNRPEIGAMFSLSAAQAAATLAAIVVGLEIGLLDESTVNAVMMVILITCLVAPAAASRYAAALPRPPRTRDLGDVVVVPVANPRSVPHLIDIASRFARADGGIVVPVTIAAAGTGAEELQAVRDLDLEVIEVAHSAGAEARTVFRIDATAATGIAHTVVEQEATLLVLGWTGTTESRGATFGAVIDDVLSHTNLPTLLSYDGGEPIGRILIIVDRSVTTPAGGPAVELALEAAKLLARPRNLPIEVVGDREDQRSTARIEQQLGREVQHDTRRRAATVTDHARPNDLIIVPTIGDEPNLRSVAAPIAAAAPPGASLLIALDTSPITLDHPSDAATGDHAD